MDKQVKRMLAAKMFTHEEIAKHIGVSRSRVTQLANNQGTRKKQNTLTSQQWEELLAQYPDKTITYLADKYSISRAAIYRKLKNERYTG